MKKLITMMIMVLCATSLFAQAPEKFTYQSVVRLANNSLAANTQIGVRISILQGTVVGNAVFVETHIVNSNANGLITLEIGSGNIQVGSISDIDWADGPYFLRTETDPYGGIDYIITSTQQLMSVPYALYAKESGNGFSGDYNDLTNTPQIPTEVSAFNNDAGYITMDSIPTNVSTFANDAGYITGYTEIDPLFSAWDKDYNDLINTPTIPTVPTNISAFINDAGYLTDFTEQQILTISNDTIFLTGGSFVKLPAVAAGFSGDYNDLTNTPIIPTIPTNVSAFINDAGYLTDFTEQQILTISNDTIFLTGGSFVKLPEGFSGNYYDLINRPSLAAVAISGNYNDLTNKPVIPTIPTNVSAFTNDAGYLTDFTEQQILTISNDTIFLTGGSFVKLPAVAAGFSGDYNDLTNTPIIPTIPTNVSAFINDAGYLTDFTEQQILTISNDTIFLTGGSFVKLPEGFSGNYYDLINRPSLAAVAISGNYNDLTNKPVIPTIPTNVSAFTNDAGYLTNFTEQQILTISNDTIFLTGGSFVKLPEGFDGDYNSLTNTPNIPTVPENVSAFSNDAGYVSNIECADVDLCALAAALAQLQALVEEQQQRIEELEAQMGEGPSDTTVTPSDTTTVECHPFLNIHDTTVNRGAQVTLSVTDTTMGSVQWTWPGGSASGNSITVTPSSTMTYKATAIHLGPELIVNGDFEQGNVGFTSEYEYHNYQTEDRVDEGTYTIGEDSGGYVESLLWEHGSDHTTGSGNMLIVNGWIGSGIKTIWSQTITVQPNTQYQFSYWVKSLFPPHPQLSIFLNDIPQDDAFAGFTDYNLWTNNSILWNSGQNSQVVIKIVELTNSGLGNDPCFDDISFRAVIGSNVCVDSAIVTVISSDTTVTPIDTTTFECHPFLNIHDTTVNYGASVTLSVTDTSINGVTWTWSGGQSSGDSLTVTPNVTTTYYATVMNLGPELIVNGDFEQGNVGFTSEYPCGNNYSDGRMHQEGEYVITDNARYQAWDWLDSTDHTTSTGLYLISNGDPSGTMPVLYSTTVNVQPNTEYVFSMWVKTFTTSPQLHISINDLPLEAVGNTTLNYIWQECKENWQSGSSTQAVIKIVNHNTEAGGNDFGLDDISFRAVIDSNACVDSVVVTVNPLGQCDPCEGTPTVTDYDGNVYNTVQIGNQCWTRENLRAKHFADGEAIVDGVSNPEATYRFYYSNNNSSTTEMYGLLYDYKTASQTTTPSDNTPSGVQGICPAGWHLPSNSEYDILLNFVNSVDAYKCNGQVGKAFCAPITWNSHGEDCYVGNNPETNNATCFSMVAAGWTGAGGDGGPVDFGITADIWTSTRGDFGTDCDKTGIEWYNHDMGDGYCFSVRCLRNESRMVVTTPIIELSDSMAVCGGGVILANNNLNASISVRGVCWAETENPSIEGNHTNNGAEVGSFTSILTLLQPGTIYYARAYAIIDGEPFYGNQISFKTYSLPNPPQPCPGTPTLTDIDGNVYNTVQIGEQCWMRENLRTTHYPDGSEIAIGNNTTPTGIPVYYQNTEYDTLFGLFYTLQAAMYHANGSNNNPSGVQGICPSGWHLPSQAEWEQLHNKVNEDYPNEAAKALAANTELWQENATLHTVGNSSLFNNMSGFSALPTGYYNHDEHNFIELGQRVIFWSSTTSGNNLRYYHFWYNGDNGGFEEVNRHAKPVRCLKNPDGMTYLPYVITDSANLVSDNSITVYGTVASNDGGDVTERGFCWSSEDQNPSLDHSHIALGSSQGSFSHTFSGLEDGGYYFRAYAINASGLVYGDALLVIVCNDTTTYGLTCPGAPTVTDYDGNVYNTVQIGEQCWMRENLRVMHYADGSMIDGAYHHTDSAVQTIYYLWGSVVNGSEGSNTVPSGIQGVCPTGWHVPSAAEFEILINYTNIHYVTNDGESTAKALSSKVGWNHSTNAAVPGENCHNNTTGFSAVPDGCGYYNVYYQEEGYRAYLSSATPDGGYFKPFIIMADNSQAQIGSHAQWYSFPVRCLRN